MEKIRVDSYSSYNWARISISGCGIRQSLSVNECLLFTEDHQAGFPRHGQASMCPSTWQMPDLNAATTPTFIVIYQEPPEARLKNEERMLYLPG